MDDETLFYMSEFMLKMKKSRVVGRMEETVRRRALGSNMRLAVLRGLGMSDHMFNISRLLSFVSLWP